MKFRGIELHNILMQLSEVTEGEQNLSNPNIRKLLAAAYGQLTGKYGPIIRALPAVAGPISKDLTPIVCAVVDIATGVAGSAEFKKSYGSLVKARAELRMTSMKAYEDAGFTRREAFYLVLQDASRKLTMPNLPSSSSQSKE